MVPGAVHSYEKTRNAMQSDFLLPPDPPTSVAKLRTREKRGLKVGKTKRGKGTKIMAVADRHGLPVAVSVESATPHEVKLATNTLVQMVVPDTPQVPLCAQTTPAPAP